MMKKMGHSRAVYEVNVTAQPAPGPSHADDTKVRRHEETPIPATITNPRKEEHTKFKFTKFPVRKQDNAKETRQSPATTDVMK